MEVPMTLVSICVSQETREMLRKIDAQQRRPMSAIVHDAAMAYPKNSSGDDRKPITRS